MSTANESFGILTVADALKRDANAMITGSPEDDAYLGSLAVSAALICQAATVPIPPPQLRMQYASALESLPPQFECLDPASRFGQWISIAALCELANANALAWLILDSLDTRLDESVAAEAGAEAIAELHGLCLARRGRIARVAGRLEDASTWYRDAQLAVRGLPWRDAAPHAAMGLAVVAVGRGNLPAADKRVRTVLAHRPVASAMYRVQAHQVRSFTLRRKGRLLDALLHSWHAFDLLDSSDIRRPELLIAMGEIAVDYGDWPAALAGFSAALQAASASRVRIPALVGIVDGHRKLGDRASDGFRTTAIRWMGELEALAQASVAPRDRVLAATALVEGNLCLGNFDQAREWIELLDDEAEQHGFHESRLRTEALRAELEKQSLANASHKTFDQTSPVRQHGFSANSDFLYAAPDPLKVVRSARVREQHPALRRLTVIGGAGAPDR